MELIAKIWRDPVWSKVISAAIIGIMVLISQQFLGGVLKVAYEDALMLVQIPTWAVALWGMATLVLVVIAGRALLRGTLLSGGEVTLDLRSTPNPKIEIVTGPMTPYHVTDVQSGQVQNTVRIGIKNGGGQTLSNCKVYIEKLSPPTNSTGGATLLLDGSGFQLRHDDPEKIVEVATHWVVHDKFRFSTPIGGGFFDSTQWMDDNTRRTFAIRVTAMECERSALFEILADESRKLHLKLLNYIN